MLPTIYNVIMSPPDVVGVPVLMDDDLFRADGNGTSLVVLIQSMFSQVDSVGATAAWPQKTEKHCLKAGNHSSIQNLFYSIIQV